MSKYLRQPTGDGSDTLYSTEFQQAFHSKHGALTEAEHVFLRGTGVDKRLAQRLPTRILEIGFGTGLNFWATVAHSQAVDASLHYVAVDKELLADQILRALNHGQQLESIRQMRHAFLEWRAGLPDLTPPAHLRWQCVEQVGLELLLGDGTAVQIPNLAYHAIYHDAFSPDVDPKLWTLDFLAQLFGVLAKGGTLASYSVKGTVRRSLRAVGFEVRKLPGPPGKREMLVAKRPAE